MITILLCFKAKILNLENSQNRPDFYTLISRSFLIMFFYQGCLSRPFSTPSSVIFSTELNWYKDDGLILICLSFLPQLFVSIALLVLSPGISAYVPILQHAGVVISESFVLLHVVSAGKLLFFSLDSFFLKSRIVRNALTPHRWGPST